MDDDERAVIEGMTKKSAEFLARGGKLYWRRRHSPRHVDHVVARLDPAIPTSERRLEVGVARKAGDHKALNSPRAGQARP